MAPIILSRAVFESCLPVRLRAFPAAFLRPRSAARAPLAGADTTAFAPLAVPATALLTGLSSELDRPAAGFFFLAT